jgi:hypothetical protein
MCGDELDNPMQVDVCGQCYQELRSSGAVPLLSTAEFAPFLPAKAEERLKARRTRSGEIEAMCTWCGKPRKDVKKLLASGDARICNECVALCADVLEAELGADWR